MIKVVFFSLLLDLIAFAIILPLFPVLLEYYGKHDDGGLYASLQRSVDGFRSLVGAPDNPRWNAVLFGGLIGSTFSLLQFLSSPIMGAASDKYGRKPVLLLSAVGVAVSYAVWAVSSTFTLFALARVISGLCKGNVGISTAVVADVTTPKTRGKGMAAVGIAFSIGFIIGPLIGAYFSMKAKDQEGMFFVTPALLALTLAVLDILYLTFFFKETFPAEKRRKSTQSLTKALSLINPVSLFNFSAVKMPSFRETRSLRRIGLVYFLYLFMFSGIEFTLTFLTYNRFEFTSMQQGRMFLVIGITMIVIQGGVVRRVTPGRELAIASMGLITLIPAIVIVGWAWSIKMLYTGVILFSIASATVVPCLTAVVSGYGGDDEKGMVLGIFRSLGALARALGPVVSCTLYWCFGARICYGAAGFALLLPVLLLVAERRTASRTPTGKYD